MSQKINQATAQQIVETVRDVCERNINFIGTDGIIYASTDQSRIGTFHEIGKQVVLRRETVEVSTDDAFFGTHAGVNIPITYKEEIEGVIGISGPPEEVRKYAYLAQRIAILLLREQELESESASHKNRINFVVQSLIDEQQSKNKRVERYLMEKKMDPSERYRTILIELNRRYNPNNLSMIEQTVYQVFQQTGSELYTFHYPNGYVLILGNDRWEACRPLFDQLSQEQKDLLRIGAGEGYPVEEVYRSYQEAKFALRSSKKGRVSEYGEMGVELLSASADEKTAALYRKKFLGTLKEEEIRLLRIYYENEMSLAKTGEILFLHKNTIQYQLDKIFEKTGKNPRKFTDAAGFYAALFISF